MRRFPVFLTLKDRTAVVVGDTEATAGKVRLLLRSEAGIILVAIRMVDTLEQLVTAGRVHLHRGPFIPALLEEAVMVFAATANA